MKIESLILTKEELNQAVQDFLNWKNVKVKVLTVEAKGYPLREWEVQLDTASLAITEKTEVSNLAPPSDEP